MRKCEQKAQPQKLLLKSTKICRKFKIKNNNRKCRKIKQKFRILEVWEQQHYIMMMKTKMITINLMYKLQISSIYNLFNFNY